MATLARLKYAAIAALIVVSVLAVTGIGKLEFNSHYTAYFDADDPLLIAHRDISRTYSRRDAVFVVLQSDDSFLAQGNYRLLESLTSALSAQEHVTSAVSITELGIIGELETAEGDLIPTFEQLAEQGRAIGLLIDGSTRLAGIWVQYELPDNKARTVLDIMYNVRSATNAAVSGLPVSAHFTGTLALNESYIDVVRHDLTRIVPSLLVVMMLVLAWLLRSVRAVMTLLPVGVFSVVAAFGIVGMAGAELAAINSFVPVILLSISLAGCVHMSLSFNHYREKGLAACNAALEAARYNLMPMALANGTTALGFLGLSLSPSPPIRVVGYLVAAGIAISFLLCMTLLPVLQSRVDPWRPANARRFQFLDRMVTEVRQQRGVLTTVFLILAVPATWFASRNVINDNVFEYFVPSHAFYRDTQLVEQRLSGVNEVLYSVESGREFGFFDAGAVEAIDGLARWLRTQPEVNRVISIADIDVIAEAHHEGRLQERLDFYRSRLQASQQNNPLLALEVSADYSSSVVTAYLQQMDSGALIEFDQRTRGWASENIGDYTLRSGGPTLLFANLGEKNIRGMLLALSAALLAAAFLLGTIFRSPRVGIVALVCNMLPVLLVYSVWAVLVGQLSIGAAVVMGMILGIVIDDTIYLLATYRRGLERGNAEPIRYAMNRVGPALIITTMTLVAGLSLGMISQFGPIWSMSVLSAAIIATALLIDLVLLPALLPATNNDRA